MLANRLRLPVAWRRPASSQGIRGAAKACPPRDEVFVALELLN